jgi:hypothetical protein
MILCIIRCIYAYTYAGTYVSTKTRIFSPGGKIPHRSPTNTDRRSTMSDASTGSWCASIVECCSTVPYSTIHSVSLLLIVDDPLSVK